MLQPKKNRKSAEMAALLEEYEGRAPVPRAGFQPGEHVHGRVVSVGDRVVTIDLDAKTPGVIDRAAFGEDLPLPEPGDEIDAYFVALEDGAARLSLSGGAQLDASDEAIGAAMAAGLPLEGKYEKEVNGGFEVRVNGQRAFCPYSQVALHRPREGAPSPVGTTDTFLVVEYNPAEHTLVVSHRALEERAREERRRTLQASLFEGDFRNGVVTKVMPFGAFVDIGGVEGLIPNSEISWDRSVKPGDVLHEGDEVQIKVRRVDWENDRFTFSLKDLAKDPWQDYCEDFGAGSHVTGTVVKLAPFGAFVQLVPGVDGLIPIASLGRGRHIVDPGEVVKIGEELDLKIESMDPVARRISLSVIDKRVAALKPGEIGVGARLEGIVESCRDFGVFVRLSEERTGLLHVSETGIPKGGNNQALLEKKFPPDSKVEVVVKSVEGDRVSLTLPSVVAAQEAAEAEERDAQAALRANRESARSTGFGNLGSLFDAALGGAKALPPLVLALSLFAAAPAPARTPAGARGAGPSAEQPAGLQARDRAAAPDLKEPWHLFGAPAEDTAAAQMARARRFEAEGRRSAARKAYDSLVHNWGASPEASESQLSVARLFEADGDREEAFREYQYWIERYAATSPVPGTTYESVVAAQFALANALRAEIGGGPLSPSTEMVASMYRHVVANAPDAPRAAEAVLGEGACYEADGAWAKAVNAYERLGSKYPSSPLVPASRYRAAACRYRLAKRYPNDEATLRNALEMLRFAIRTDPQNEEAPEARRRADELAARQTRMAFDRAEFYDRVRDDAPAAVLAYEQFLRQFPNAPESPRARERIEALRPSAAN